MRYIEQLKLAASWSGQGFWGAWRRRRYLRENAKKLSVAACASDPVAALRVLGEHYQAESQPRGGRAKVTDRAHMAELLMEACQRLALGQEPAPIIPDPPLSPRVRAAELAEE
jgi:hypothetical protein